MRTSAEEVKKILETELEDSTINAYITGANTLVTKVLGTGGLGETLLTEIERWMTAHLIASTRERQAKKEEAGGAKVEYTGQYGSGLESTSYGQTVLSLDTSGRMKSLSRRPVIIRAVKT